MRKREWMASGAAVAMALALLVSGGTRAQDLPVDPPVAGEPMVHSSLGEYLAGRIAHKLDDLGPAADMMAEALAHDPDNPELLQNTYLLMASEGRMEEAGRLADRLYKSDPTRSAGAITLALRAAEAERFDEADRYLTGLSENDGLNEFVLPLLRSWIALGQNKPDDALSRLEPLGKIQGFEPVFRIHKGLLNDVAGRAAAAEEIYKQVVEKPDESALRFIQIVGNFYQRQGKPELARTLYAKFKEGNGDNALIGALEADLAKGAKVRPVIGTAREGMAEALFQLATVLYREQADDMALLFVRYALQVRPEFPMAQVLLADILRGQHRLAEAIDAYRAVPRDGVFGWQARLSAAETLNELDRSEEAIATLRQMVGERPDRADAAIILGNVLRAHERWKEAVDAYDVAVQRLGDVPPRDWSVLYFRGIAHERNDQWSLAEADFLKALELEPDHPFVMNYLAYTWVEKGQNYDRALNMLQRAVALRPEDGFIVDSLGWVFFRLGRYQEAVEQLERAVELRPQDAVLNDHLGDAYWKVGRKKEARFQWQRALASDPEDKDIARIQGKLANGLAASGS